MARVPRSPSRAPYIRSWRKASEPKNWAALPDKPAAGWLCRLAQWLASIGVGALAVFLGAYASGLLHAVLPSFPELACEVCELTRSHEPNAKFRILLATLEYDANGQQTGHVRDAVLGSRHRTGRNIR